MPPRARWPALPERFRTPANASVVAYLDAHEPSAHSDLVHELETALEHVDGCVLHCPDHSRYAYVAGCDASDRIFALALGMQAIWLCLPEPQLDAALQDGAERSPEVGAGWVCFEAFIGDMTRSRARLARWAAVAAS